MQINRCANCMGETEDYPCSRCGFDANVKPQPGYALPRNTILHGKYLVGRMLGQGGFGITYVGFDLTLEVKVAIKEFYPSGQVSRQSTLGCSLVWNSTQQSEASRNIGMDSFLKEARKMARVDRIPQVVRVRETFRENDTAYIIMDFVEGETLKGRLEREGPMPFERAMEIFRPAIAAMEEVHKAGLIHRDLSPDNLMLEPGGGVRILDLGAAKDLAANHGVSSMLVTKGGFSPLEQYSQRGGSGPWTDVYAMAATIYYTLTGRVPPNAIDRLDDDELRWDLPALQALGAPAREALQKALVLTAKGRTQTMSEMLVGLEQTEPKPGPKPEPDPEPEPVPDPEPEPEPEPKPNPEPEPEPEPKPNPEPEPEPEPKPNPEPPPKPKFKLRISLLCAAVLIFAVCIFARMNAGAEIIASGEAGPSVTWTLDDAGVLTVSGSGEMENYDDEAKKAPWYDFKDSITSLTVESGVTSIGDYAVFECTRLSSITIPDSVTVIGNEAFWRCTSLGSVMIPNSITAIGEAAFYECTSLNSIAIPDSVTAIGEAAFYECISLKSITLPEGVTSIEMCAFYECTSLESITLPEGVTEIGNDAFAGCTSLESITLPEGMTAIGEEAFYDCASLKSITISAGVTEIGSLAFGGCTSLTDVYYSGTEAQWANLIMFSGETLENVAIHFMSSTGQITVHTNPGAEESPSSAEIIASGEAGPSFTWTLDVAGLLTIFGSGEMDDFDSEDAPWYTFRESIISLLLEPGVTTVGEYAFNGCTSLKSIALPESVTEIRNCAFRGCTSLESITLPEGVTCIGAWTFSNCASLESIMLPEGVTEIKGSTFMGCTSLKSITLPEGVICIGVWTFSNCTSLESIILPEGVNKIGDRAFEGCTSLKSIALPESVTEIRNSAFCDCVSLKSIALPASVTKIGYCAFSSCTSLTDVYYSGTEAQWNSITMAAGNENLTNANIHYNS